MLGGGAERGSLVDGHREDLEIMSAENKVIKPRNQNKNMPPNYSLALIEKTGFSDELLTGAYSEIRLWGRSYPYLPKATKPRNQNKHIQREFLKIRFSQCHDWYRLKPGLLG